MTWKGFLAAVFALPALIALAGVGILAWKVGDTWDSRNTDLLVGGTVAACVSGVVLFALIVGAVLGLAALRRTQQSEVPSYPPMINVQPSPRPPAWAEQPPMLTDKNAGSWQTAGESYNLWEDEQPQTTPADQWREG